MADRLAVRAAWSSVPLTVLGLGVSAYLTWAHYTAGTSLACPDTGIINCAKVTSSSESMVGPVPVAVLGIVFFAVMTAVCLPHAWATGNRTAAVVRIGGVSTAMLAVLYLVAVELVRLHALCLWCSAVHLITFALFVVVLVAQLRLAERAS